MIPMLKLQPFLPKGIGARGNPVQFVIGGPDYKELVRWRDIMLEKAKTYPGITDIDYDYFSYLLSLTEMIPVNYGARTGQSIEQTIYLGFQYMRAIYDSIRK